MADVNTPDASVTFDADPKLEADTGAGAIDFDAEPEKPGATARIREEASKLGNQAADRARAFAGEGKEKATGALETAASMMEKAALEVDEKLGVEYGRYARSAAQGVSGFAEALRGKEVDDLIEDATAFVRKSPVVAIGVAAGVGFVLARLIKSGIDAAADLADRDEQSDTPKA